ncbi:hypothetical protein ACOMHN_062772 [Nucella lapillus]
MEGVRVTGIDAQCSVQVLWQYFDETGGVVKDIYYPLLNNDAVIIFRRPSGTTDVLTRNHKKWKVLPLPNQVFRRQCVWVESDLSMLIQATGAYQDSLRNMGQVDLTLDNNSQELMLSGQPYQIEWAWNYLSFLRDNQFHIARSLQTGDEDYSASGLPNGSPAVGNSVYEQPYQEKAQSSHGLRQELQKKQKISGGEITDVTALRLENLTNTRHTMSPLSPDPFEDVCRGGTRSQNLHAEDAAVPSIKQTSAFSEKQDSKRSFDARERRRRQDDANETFNNFASLPASNGAAAYNYRDSLQHRDPDHHSSGSRRDVLPDQTELEKLEKESRLERQFQSVGYRDSGDDYHLATGGGYRSLQMDFARARESEDGVAERMRTSYTKEKAPSSAARAAESPLYALSAASADLACRDFQLEDSLKLKVYIEDITQSHTEAVVNAANWELKNIGGVAGALARAAGPEMATECSKLLDKHGSLATGQVVKTKAYGKLSHLKYVIHTVGPIYIESDIERSVFELAQTFFNCLEFAEKLHLTSITFPFISTGIFGMPIEHCVLSLVTALKLFIHESTMGARHLREVHFINNDMNVVCEAIILTEQRLSMETVHTARDRLEEGRRRHGRFVFPFCQGSAHYDSERYATWDSSKAKPGMEPEGDRLHSRLTTRPSSSLHLSGAAAGGSGEPWSSTGLAARSGDPRQRSSSLDRRNMTSTIGSSQPHSSQRTSSGRDPSPRPQPRPRSNSLTQTGRSSGAPTKPSTTTTSQHRGAGGKQQPVIKKSLTGVSSKTTSGLARKLATKKSSPSAGRSGDYSGNDTDSASAAGSEMEDGDRICSICVEPLRHPKRLLCGHIFCADCITHAFAVKPCCPRCKAWLSGPKGMQPKDGIMSFTYSQHSDLPGHEGSGTIVIKYVFPSGTQEVHHPNPGRHYEGVHHTAYLPDNMEGNEVLKMLKRAFDQGQVFTIGDTTRERGVITWNGISHKTSKSGGPSKDSLSTGERGVITWNGITHKTSKTGGPSKSGYPDPGFMKRVKAELAAKGITSK